MSYKHKSGSAKHKQKLEIKEKKKKLPKIDTFLTKKKVMWLMFKLVHGLHLIQNRLLLVLEYFDGKIN
jgi:hypothetical protein